MLMYKTSGDSFSEHRILKKGRATLFFLIYMRLRFYVLHAFEILCITFMILLKNYCQTRVVTRIHLGSIDI